MKHLVISFNQFNSLTEYKDILYICTDINRVYRGKTVCSGNYNNESIWDIAARYGYCGDEYTEYKQTGYASSPGSSTGSGGTTDSDIILQFDTYDGLPKPQNSDNPPSPGKLYVVTKDEYKNGIYVFSKSLNDYILSGEVIEQVIINANAYKN